jgi:DNA-binding beta-propeller fold protein YncE
MVLDQRRGKIFQNIKTSNSLQVIDLNMNTVAAEYALGDLKSPHGLAEDRSTGRLFAVGKNGKLVTLDADSGKILSTVDVTKNSDQIAYDAGLKRLYIPGSGALQILEVQDDGPKVIDTVPAPAGCHSITVDSNTHNVWVAYTDKVHSYVMKFVVPK